MTSFSLFWEKHYKDVGFCCIYYPLESNFMKDKNDNGEWTERKLITYIDTDWMGDKKMKWIGYDRGGYLAWITPGGQLYNFDDLKRNEDGKRYEKEIGKLKISGDGNMPTDAGGDMDFYEWELMVLKKCGFCPGSGGSGKDKDESDQEEEPATKSSATPNTYIPSWQGLAKGGAPDYAGIYGPGQSAVTDAGDVKYGAGVTDTGYVQTANKYAGFGIGGGGGTAGDDGTKTGDGSIPKIPYSGLVALPVDKPAAFQPKPVQVPKLPNPVINTDGVIKTVVPPQKNANTNVESVKTLSINRQTDKIDNLRTKPIIDYQIPPAPSQNPNDKKKNILNSPIAIQILGDGDDGNLHPKRKPGAKLVNISPDQWDMVKLILGSFLSSPKEPNPTSLPGLIHNIRTNTKSREKAENEEKLKEEKLKDLLKEAASKHKAIWSFDASGLDFRGTKDTHGNWYDTSGMYKALFNYYKQYKPELTDKQIKEKIKNDYKDII